MELLRSLIQKGFFHLLSANVVIGLLGFGSQLLVVKFLSPTEIGQIKTLQSLVGVAAVLAGFGFNSSVLKLCSEARPDAEKAAIFRRNLLYTVTPTIIVVIALGAAARYGLLSPDVEINQWMLVYMFMIPAGVFTAIMMAYLQARKRIKTMASTQTGIRLFGVVVLIGATYYLGFSGYMMAVIATAYLALVPLVFLVRKDLVADDMQQPGFGESFYFARWSTAANSVATLGFYLDVLFLNYMIEDREGFGYYSVATIFMLGLTFITTTVQSIAAPYFSEKAGDRHEFMRVLKKYQKLLMLLSFGVMVVAAAIGPWFITTVYGEEYASAGIYFRWLTLKYFFWSCGALLGIAIWGLGKVKHNVVTIVISTCVSGVMSYIFIQKMGIMGVAVAQVIAYFLNAVIMALMMRHVLKIHFGSKDVTQ